MSLIKRIKRLWELSGTEEPPAKPNALGRYFTSKARAKRDQRLATILQEDPLDVFPSDTQENDSTSERPPTDRAD